MQHKYDELTAFVFGIGGGSIGATLIGITWQNAWESLGHLLWVGFIALFSGAMGVLGKHLISKLFRKNKK